MLKRISAILGLAAVFMLMAVPFAFAEPTTTTNAPPAEIVGGAAESLLDQLLDTAVTVLPYAATIAALFIGWRIVRRFMR